MKFAFVMPLLIPGILAADVPPHDRQVLVAKHVALVKSAQASSPATPVNEQLRSIEKIVADLSLKIAHESRPGVRQLMLTTRHLLFSAMSTRLGDLPENVAAYASAMNLSALLELCGQIQPDSPALDLAAEVSPEFLGTIAWHASGGGFAHQSEADAASKAYLFLDQVFDRHPNPKVKLLALESSIELHSGPRDVEDIRRGLLRLEAFDPKAPSIPRWRAWLQHAEEEVRTRPRVGDQVAAFAVGDLDRPGTILTPQSFKGKYWLLDFWATWCGPCKKELPFVHQAYAKYHPMGLEILGISRDRKVEDIGAFRNDPEHPMPWHHAFPEGPALKAIMNAFKVRGIPHILLIGPDGRILATERLRGEDLDRTLGTFLKNL